MLIAVSCKLYLAWAEGPDFGNRATLRLTSLFAVTITKLDRAEKPESQPPQTSNQRNHTRCAKQPSTVGRRFA